VTEINKFAPLEKEEAVFSKKEGGLCHMIEKSLHSTHWDTPMRMNGGFVFLL